MHDKIDLTVVAQRYNKIENIWDKNDKWHLLTKNMIKKFIESSLNAIGSNQNIKILNVGSAGYSYDLDEKNVIHLDIAIKKILHLNNSCIADAEKIPITGCQFDLVICVGSVINYCDPIIVFREFNRVLKPNGYLIIEYENSYTLELLGTRDFNKSIVFVETFYNGKREGIWYFSEQFVNEISVNTGFSSISSKRWHIISPLIYRIFKKENFAAWFSRYDSFLSRIPVIQKFSSNLINLYKKAYFI